MSLTYKAFNSVLKTDKNIFDYIPLKLIIKFIHETIIHNYNNFIKLDKSVSKCNKSKCIKTRYSTLEVPNCKHRIHKLKIADKFAKKFNLKFFNFVDNKLYFINNINEMYVEKFLLELFIFIDEMSFKPNNKYVLSIIEYCSLHLFDNISTCKPDLYFKGEKNYFDIEYYNKLQKILKILDDSIKIDDNSIINDMITYIKKEKMYACFEIHSLNLLIRLSNKK